MSAGLRKLLGTFRSGGGDYAPALPPLRPGLGQMRHAPPIAVELDGAEEEIAALLEQTAAVWRRLGETEPHWSVLTDDKYQSAGLGPDEVEAFYASGRRDYEAVKAIFARVGEDLGRVRTVLELGSGVGRVTEWFARDGRAVTGVDISPGHISLAEARMRSLGLGKARFVRLGSVAELSRIEAADLVYSIIALQHNPPPVAFRLLEGLIGRVAQGGYILFQIPTYIRGYAFRIDGYRHNPEGMEMHCIPMRDVLGLLQGKGLRLLDVLEDDSSGSPDIISHTFFAARPS